MSTQKIQITLTPEEVAALSVKSKALGYNVTKYIKFLVAREVIETVEEYPTYKMSKRLEKLTEKAIQEYKDGKAVLLDSPYDLDKL
ncbi:hypothetical protein COY90_03445 [Candidatus Roizmanbacteria bacterium CG_4_10_14_0_8_um_filter_39_9]|uniref:CopG family transcriptional regulator n=1 Tax=Candidatus Roizmanbacteria bacterium CG_4_10_14_0_8_um_filter_39_9 TaxID=1974829 RepID=A0A2M7QCF9_9BACT|nr:MAG: hypothetical protein COY90_03445 [Candidatus Roizmanbacteria bacterium CG_4_10_14_0_8_um_filter_39_9]